MLIRALIPFRSPRNAMLVNRLYHPLDPPSDCAFGRAPDLTPRTRSTRRTVMPRRRIRSVLCILLLGAWVGFASVSEAAAPVLVSAGSRQTHTGVGGFPVAHPPCARHA